MSQRIPGEKIQCVIDEDILCDIKVLQKEVKITRSEFIRVCLKVGLESYKDGSLVFQKNIIDLTNLPKR